MPPGANSATILVVDDDAAVRHILGLVLAREGHPVFEAADAAGALQLTEAHQPQLAVVDLCLADGDGAALAGKLHSCRAGLPLILITGYPLRLHEDPGLSRRFLRVLTKPVDVNEFRLAVHAALTEGAMQTSNPSPQHDTAQASLLPNGHPAVPAPAVPASVVPAQHPAPVAHGKGEKLRSTIVVLVALAVLVGFVAYVMGLIPGMSPAQEPVVQKEEAPKIDLVPGQPHTVSIPEDVRVSLGIRKGSVDQLATAQAPTEARPLVLSGSTALDPTLLFRIRVRFTPAEVKEIGQTDETGEGPTKQRELRSGDVVRAGQRLALFFSIDVGNKKNDLVDALVQLKLDQKILEASQTAYDKGALPYLDYMAARRAVEGDYNAVGRAENTLRAWAIPEEDIEAVRKEADDIYNQGGKRDRSPEHLKAQLKKWARVELRVPDVPEADGATIVERNLSVGEMVMDPTINLFQIAKVDRLLVFANAPEEDLPRLQRLDTAKRRWTIRTAGAPDGIEGPIDDISYIIDPAQHNAVVKGHIVNDGGRLRGGQYVTATVKLPPPPDVVEIPTNALADEGKQAGVFVQVKPGVYTFRRVEVVQRFDHGVFVRSRFPDGKDEQALTPEEKEEGLPPRQALKPGEKVITAGVLELKKELEDRESSTADKK